MKTQVARFSPHQNGKVFAVLMAVSSMVFVIPLMLIVGMMGPAANAPSTFFLFLMPVIYLVLSYLMVVVGCAVYNLMFKFIGGIEVEFQQN